MQANSFISFDIETTGLNVKSDKIIEIAGVKISNGKIIEKFSKLINPNEKVSDTITSLTGITNNMLKDKPPVNEVLPQFFDFIEDYPLIAHNSIFDWTFIKNAVENENLPLDIENKTVFDSFEIMKIFLPFIKSYSLQNIAAEFNVTVEDSHRALTDSEVLADVMTKFINKIGDREKEQISRIIKFTDKTDWGQKEFFKMLLEHASNHECSEETVFDITLKEKKESFYHAEKNSSKKYYQQMNFSQKEQENQLRIIKYAGKNAFHEQDISIIETNKIFDPPMFLLDSAAEIFSVKQEKVFLTVNHETKRILRNEIEDKENRYNIYFFEAADKLICQEMFDFFIERPELLPVKERLNFIPLIVWNYLSDDGNIKNSRLYNTGFDYSLWNKLEVDSHFHCTESKCVFLEKQKNDIEKADIIVGTFEDIWDYRKAFKKSCMIFYPADEFSDFYINHKTLQLNIWDFLHLLNPLAMKYDDSIYGILPYIRNEFKEEIREKIDDLTELICRKTRKITNIFRNMTTSYHKKNKHRGEVLMIRDKDPLKNRLNQFKDLIEPILNGLSELDKLIENHDGRRVFSYFGTTFKQLSELNKHLDVLYTLLDYKALNIWETHANNSLIFDLRINYQASVIDPNEIEKEFEEINHCMFIGKNIKYNGSFDFFIEDSGLTKIKEKTAAVSQPVNVDISNIMTAVPDFYNKKSREKNAVENLGDTIMSISFADKFHRVIVSPTFQLMKDLSEYVESQCRDENILILHQGSELNRKNLINRFIETEDTALFLNLNAFSSINFSDLNVDLFFFLNLPFVSPEDPLLKKRLNKLESEERSIFLDYILPRCVLSMKNMIFKTVNNNAKSTVNIVLDKRIVHSKYSNAFKDNLSIPIMTFSNLNEAVKMIKLKLGYKIF